MEGRSEGAMMTSSVWMWSIFAVVVIGVLLLDMGVLRREQKVIGIRESLRYSAFYIFLGLTYGAAMYVWVGTKQGEDYLTGYVLEKCLSLDNIFIISLVFKHFAVPAAMQHRVLLYGISGVLLLRGIMIWLGTALIKEFDWVLYLFGLFLVVTGARMLLVKEEEKSLEENKILRILKRYIPVTNELHGPNFFVRVADAAKQGRLVRKATPLFIALIYVVIADVVFAMDSVPAILAITTDPYVVFTSNVFAILGLRALYFALEAMIRLFDRLKHALSLVLIFIGVKIFLPLVSIHISSPVALLVTLGLLGGGVVASLFGQKEQEKL